MYNLIFFNININEYTNCINRLVDFLVLPKKIGPKTYCFDLFGGFLGYTYTLLLVSSKCFPIVDLLDDLLIYIVCRLFDKD